VAAAGQIEVLDQAFLVHNIGRKPVWRPFAEPHTDG
jgi:hypothetical protein